MARFDCLNIPATLFGCSVRSAATLSVMALCGCASEETAGRYFAAPGKYILYSCGEMANEARGIQSRQRELEDLMKKAGVDAGGRFVSAQAYQPDYTLLRGRMYQLGKTAAEKSCDLSGGVRGASGPPAEQPTVESPPILPEGFNLNH
jgi:hypothetical protein